MEVSMSIRILGIAAGLSVLLPLAVFADPATTTTATAQADPVVCHYYYHEGSVINRPDCLTRHQWERRRLAQQRYIREFQMRSLDQQM
jgi:hypothetical protein